MGKLKTLQVGDSHDLVAEGAVRIPLVTLDYQALWPSPRLTLLSSSGLRVPANPQATAIHFLRQILPIVQGLCNTYGTSKIFDSYVQEQQVQSSSTVSRMMPEGTSSSATIVSQAVELDH